VFTLTKIETAGIGIVVRPFNKSKSHPITYHWRQRGAVEVYLYSFLTSALDGDGWSTPRPGRFTYRKEIRYPLYGNLGGPQGLSGRMRQEENMSHPPGFEPRTVQPVAGRYTQYNILAPSSFLYHVKIATRAFHTSKFYTINKNFK
jgi:hypothetical protein